MGFSTGSVVVPASGETMETDCRTSALSRELLPTLRRPKNPMCSRMPRGALFMFTYRPIGRAARAV